MGLGVIKLDNILELWYSPIPDTWGSLIISQIIIFILLSIVGYVIKDLPKFLWRKFASSQFVSNLKSYKKQLVILYKIKKFERNNKKNAQQPQKTPPGINIQEQFFLIRLYSDIYEGEKNPKNKSKRFDKLTEKINYYRENFPQRFENYLKNNPKEKQKYLDRENNLNYSMKILTEDLTRSFTDSPPPENQDKKEKK